MFKSIPKPDANLAVPFPFQCNKCGHKAIFMVSINEYHRSRCPACSANMEWDINNHTLISLYDEACKKLFGLSISEVRHQDKWAVVNAILTDIKNQSTKSLFAMEVYVDEQA